LFPRRTLIDGKHYRAGIAGDFAVDREHRGVGPALSLQRAAVSNCRERRFDVLYGFPNRRSQSILQRAGYKAVADVLRMTKPLRSRYYLKRRIETPFVTRALSRPVDFVIRLISGEYHRNQNRYSFETPSFFDERFDDLWKKGSTRFPIIGERTSSYLNWRYARSPHVTYSVFALTPKGDDALLGYIVYHIRENKANIADLFSLDLDVTLDLLISGFINHLRKNCIDSVTVCYAGTQVFINKLLDHGFSIREREGKIVVYSPSDNPLYAFLLNKENWYLMPGDNDI
jgi:hypothetical protein